MSVAMLQRLTAAPVSPTSVTSSQHSYGELLSCAGFMYPRALEVPRATAFLRMCPLENEPLGRSVSAQIGFNDSMCSVRVSTRLI